MYDHIGHSDFHKFRGIAAQVMKGKKGFWDPQFFQKALLR
ncbi:hypothetical protein HMPREF1548_00549 [Clostridium sp. KLE 1755]|nr:hypothetical protein HMPREF1548_00549 [Clostridium sp. KLE 1755]